MLLYNYEASFNYWKWSQHIFLLFFISAKLKCNPFVFLMEFCHFAFLFDNFWHYVVCTRTSLETFVLFWLEYLELEFYHLLFQSTVCVIVVSIDLFCPFFKPFLYNGVDWGHLVLSIYDILAFRLKYMSMETTVIQSRNKLYIWIPCTEIMILN